MADSLRACALTVILAACVSIGEAQDTVYLASPTSSRGYMRVSGTVTDYTGAGVVIEALGKRQVYRAERVQRIETQRTDLQRQGDSLFAAKDFPAALAVYRGARDRETRPWVRREITARIVWCYRALGQATSAASEFRILVQADPVTPYFDCIPLAWFSSYPSGNLTQAARSWLREEDMPAVVLLGASYLLTQTEHGATALARLQALANSPNKTVAQLALAQTWRTMVVSATPSQVTGWEATVESMPPGLRAGPYYVVGQGWARNQEWNHAALALIRVPVLHAEHRQLAPRALFDAGMALDKLQRHEESRRLYIELLRDFPESPLVIEAESRLKASSDAQPQPIKE